MSGEADPARGPRSARVGKRLALVLLVVLVVGGPFIYWRTYRSLEWYCWLDRRPFSSAAGCPWTVEVWAHRFRENERVAYLFDPDGNVLLADVNWWRFLGEDSVEMTDRAGKTATFTHPSLAAVPRKPGQMSSYGWPIPDPFYVRWPKLPMRTDMLPYPLESPPPR